MTTRPLFPYFFRNGQKAFNSHNGSFPFCLLHRLIIFSRPFLRLAFVVFFSSQTDQAHGNLAWGSHSIKIRSRLVAKHSSLCLATETGKCVNTQERGPHAQLISAISLIALCASAFVIRCGRERGRAPSKKKGVQEESCH